MSPTRSGPRIGDIVLVLFPFTDLSSAKPRPALILAVSTRGDLVIAFITSQPQGAAPDCVELTLGSPDFVPSGLTVASTIRLSRIATVEARLVRQQLGVAGPSTMDAVRESLRFVFGL